MRRPLQILGCSVALAALGLLVTASALAGSGTSAGDQQYVDPLTTSTAQTTTQSSTTPSAATTPTSPAASTTTAGTTNTSTTATSSSSTSAAHASSGTLPFTGLNIGACAAVGVGLLGGGLLLRRAVARG